MRLVIATCYAVVVIAGLFFAFVQNTPRHSSSPSATARVDAAEKIARLVIERNGVYRNAIPLNLLVDIDTRCRLRQLANDLNAALADTPSTLEDWEYVVVLAVNENKEYINAIPKQLATEIYKDPRCVELRASIRRYLPVLQNAKS